MTLIKRFKRIILIRGTHKPIPPAVHVTRGYRSWTVSESSRLPLCPNAPRFPTSKNTPRETPSSSTAAWASLQRPRSSLQARGPGRVLRLEPSDVTCGHWQARLGLSLSAFPFTVAARRDHVRATARSLERGDWFKFFLKLRFDPVESLYYTFLSSRSQARRRDFIDKERYEQLARHTVQAPNGSLAALVKTSGSAQAVTRAP
jgi:hypothetical protein